MADILRCDLSNVGPKKSQLKLAHSILYHSMYYCWYR